MKQKINCEFEIDEDWTFCPAAYVAKIEDQTIVESSNAHYDFRGRHVEGKTNADVEVVYFNCCSISKIPQNLTECFPNMKCLQIDECKLKTIRREDLAEYNKLIDLTIARNSIVYLPGDLLADLKNLLGIWFDENHTEIIGANFLDGLDHLRVVDLSENNCIDMYYDSLDGEGNATLQQIKAEILQSYLNSPWKAVIERSARLEQEVEQLKAYKSFGVYADFIQLMNNDDSKDFAITVGDEEFKAHKFVLAARSPVLADMINNNKDAECLNLVDIKVETFEKILKFIYTDEFPVDANFIELFATAARLKIEKLKNYAGDMLLCSINSESAFEILCLSNKFDHRQLRERSFEEIRKVFDGLKVSDNLATDPAKLKKLLDMKRKKDEMMRTIDEEISNFLSLQ